MREFDQDQRLAIAERLRAAQKGLEVELKAADERDERESIVRALRTVRKMVDKRSRSLHCIEGKRDGGRLTLTIACAPMRHSRALRRRVTPRGARRCEADRSAPCPSQGD